MTHTLNRTLLLLAVMAFGLGASLASNHGDMPHTVVDIVVSSEDHTTLAAAVVEAGLGTTLSEEGPFTVFAPTDAAFEAALEALGISAEELLADPALADILGYHVVPQRLLAADVLAAIEAGDGEAVVTTVQGASLTVTLSGDQVMVNGSATVTATDLEAGNGVVHVIDGVLLPPEGE
ncbi:MAG: fasciclin domain-containing protein [Trueperaceae bacterium]|nr:fasciclin domain-containing protein [Trueperaceae bacterium]